jgi:hypothetical protein
MPRHARAVSAQNIGGGSGSGSWLTFALNGLGMCLLGLIGRGAPSIAPNWLADVPSEGQLYWLVLTVLPPPIEVTTQ